MRIDAHQHFWRVARGDYGWLTPDAHPTICRDFTPGHLAPLMAEAGVEHTILVQAAPTVDETRFLLEIAAENPFVAGVVGWADLAALGAARMIEELARDPKLVGLRPMLQDLEDDAWILSPALEPALDAMEAAGLRFDALVKPRHLPHLGRLLARRPRLKVVIDHGAKPDIAGGGLTAWAAAMRDIARGARSSCCKLSGLVTEAGPGWTEEDLRPVVDALLETFGPSRLMWGSDWPVVNEASDYVTWRRAAERLVAACSRHEQAQIFGETAQLFYGLAV